MADVKITALTAISANPVNPATFPIPMVDLLDTSMAASGTTKKVTVNQILGSGGVATLASAAITGALTVGTTLGVTGASTLASASVTGALGAAGLNVTGATIPANGVYLGSANNLSFSYASTLGMTLNSTGLGIGGSAAYKLDVVGPVMRLINSAATADIFITDSGTTNGNVRLRGESNALKFITGGGVSATIDASGNLLVGTTTQLQSANSRVNVAGDFYNLNGVSLKTTNGGSGSAFIAFINESGAVIGSVNRNGATNAVNYNTSSDYRLKESIAPLNNGLARVNALKPSIYKWKSNGSDGEGFLAHELAEAVPFAVSGEKDAMNADGTIKSQGIDMSRIVPILVAAIQELTAEVNALKNA